ncbi:MAG: hypothetical protein IT534_07000 [Bauldia sp.]|nr:hypothetical protein [Bauldia sp.]
MVDFAYDVAFSFTQADEDTASKLNDLLTGRFKTFLYSRKQEVLAGADGEARFNEVFGKQSRLVVIFWRPQWGQSPFTRFEETAIRNRAYADGYDFSLFVPTQPGDLPAWLPKNRLYYGMQRFGLEGAAAVVEARLQELGAETRPESLSGRAARFERGRLFEQRREQFRGGEGNQAANEAFAVLKDTIETGIVAIAEQSPSLGIQVLRPELSEHLYIHGLRLVHEVLWAKRFVNTLNESELLVRSFAGFPRIPGYQTFEEPRLLGQARFEFDLLREGRAGYRQPPKGVEFSPEELGGELIKRYLDEAERRRGN